MIPDSVIFSEVGSGYGFFLEGWIRVISTRTGNPPSQCQFQRRIRIRMKTLGMNLMNKKSGWKGGYKTCTENMLQIRLKRPTFKYQVYRVSVFIFSICFINYKYKLYKGNIRHFLLHVCNDEMMQHWRKYIKLWNSFVIFWY